MKFQPYDVFIEQVKHLLNTRAKPGAPIQETMAPSYKQLVPVKQPLVDAAVLVLFYPVDNLPYFVLIKRVPTLHSPHGGQISLPGGKYETSDKTYLKTALRETSEEIGIPISSIHSIGPLSPLIIPISGFRVHPFAGYLNNLPHWSINTSEVSYLIEIPVKDLIDPHMVHSETIIYEGQKHKIPYFLFKGEKVWGATAMILAELKAILCEKMP